MAPLDVVYCVLPRHWLWFSVWRPRWMRGGRLRVDSAMTFWVAQAS